MIELSRALRQAGALLPAWDARASARVGARLACTDASRRALTVVAHSGDGALWAVAGLIGLACGSRRTRRLVSQGALAVLLASGGVGWIKHSVRRQRPQSIAQKPLPLWPRHDRYSFPSGHSARLLAMATVLSAAHPAAGRALGVWSAVVGLSRVALGAHYLLDVAAGLATGALAGRLARCLSADRARKPSLAE